MKNEVYDVLIRPVVTEKGTFQAEARNAYAFEVSPQANKAQIRLAVEKVYGVKVLSVRTANRKGKPRRIGRFQGTTRHWKKAVVVLHPDHHIDLF
ncbi:MAG: 50S ribosomal protein L23 [Planctomycetes bacterium]|jgi:large subunit ribosomal protein L23|nr:50S ribosomal protein L23 [Phycisphaerae bacterium]NBB96066.1 50S ribosomal protein L23 [Planctomycetota bacterium]